VVKKWESEAKNGKSGRGEGLGHKLNCRKFLYGSVLVTSVQITLWPSRSWFSLSFPNVIILVGKSFKHNLILIISGVHLNLSSKVALKSRL
jgi:hypothetical protein